MNEAHRLTQNFMQSYPIARFGKGQLILSPGDELTKIHYLTEGSVVQYDISHAGNTVIVNSFHHGDFFPLSHAFTNSRLDYFYEADSPVSTRVAPVDRVLDFITDNPKTMATALSQSFQKSDELLRRAFFAMGGSATSRVVFELLAATERIGEKNAVDGFFIPMSENDIAKRTGLSRETVNRMLRAFKTNNTVRSTNQGIEVLSVAALEKTLED